MCDLRRIVQRSERGDCRWTEIFLRMTLVIYPADLHNITQEPTYVSLMLVVCRSIDRKGEVGKTLDHVTCPQYTSFGALWRDVHILVFVR